MNNENKSWLTLSQPQGSKLSDTSLPPSLPPPFFTYRTVIKPNIISSCCTKAAVVK